MRALIVALGLALLAGCSLPALPGPSAPPAPPATVADPPAPTSVAIERLGVRSSLVPTGQNPDGTAEVAPVDQPQQASFLDWADDQADRPLVIYGHVNGLTNGKHVPGVFSKLDQIRPGDTVAVGYDDGSVVTWVIKRVRQVPKTGFPTQEVYDPVPGQIRLVTCDGAFDHAAGRYLDNFIAFGERQA